MKKTISLMAIFILMVFALGFFTACDDQVQNDDTVTEEEDTKSFDQVNDSQEPPSKPDDAEEKPVFEYYLLYDDTYAIKKLLDNTITEITIPKAYNGKAVTRIMSNAFENAHKLTSITVQDNIQLFEKGAFFGCCSLKNLVMPFIGAKRDSFETLGYIFGTASFPGAQKVSQEFEYTPGMARSDHFYIPSSLEKITVTAGAIPCFSFKGCTMIKEIVFGDGVTEIKYGALLSCDGLETVSMGKSITEIADRCFKNLSNLKNVSIGENVTKIGYSAFANCTALKSIVIPKKVSIIDYYAFDACTGMESIIFECTSGWHINFISVYIMDVTDPALNAKNLTDINEYSSDCLNRE